VIATADGLIDWFGGGRELSPVLENLSADEIGRALDQVAQPRRAPAAGTNAHLPARHSAGEFKLTLRRAAA